MSFHSQRNRAAEPQPGRNWQHPPTASYPLSTSGESSFGSDSDSNRGAFGFHDDRQAESLRTTDTTPTTTQDGGSRY